MILFILIINFKALAWTNAEKDLYQARKFYELQMNLHLKQKIRAAQIIRSQQQDLEGCREIYKSGASGKDFLKCVRFLNQEQESGLQASNSKALYEDLSLFCVEKSTDELFAERLLNQKIKLISPQWRSCALALWKQIYLTAYAKKVSHPIEMRSLVRKAEFSLGKNRTWREKIENLSQ